MDTKKGFPLAIVVSRFNEDITTALKQGALARWAALGYDPDWIRVVEVPGAVEIPLVALKLAKSKQVKAIITLGAVILGETDHYRYVCDQASQGCQRVMLDHEIPVIFKILMTHTKAQAWARTGGSHGHHGEEAIDCAIEMVNILEQFQER